MFDHPRNVCSAVAAFTLLLAAPVYGQPTVEQCTDEWESSTAFSEYCDVGARLDVEVTSDGECDITTTCHATISRTYVIAQGDTNFCDNDAYVYLADDPAIGQTCTYEIDATRRVGVTAELDQVSNLVLCASDAVFVLSTTSC